MRSSICVTTPYASAIQFSSSDLLKLVDPTGEFACGGICIAAGVAWAVFEVAGTAADGVEAVQTLADKDAPAGAKAASTGLFLLGVVGPGGGYSKIDDAAEIVVDAANATEETVGALRAAGRKDAHHVIQDAAARDIPGYDTAAAPGVQLPGPSSRRGTPHYRATHEVQRQRGGGSYAAERRIGYKALRVAGFSPEAARAAIASADVFFARLGITAESAMRIPGDRNRP